MDERLAVVGVRAKGSVGEVDGSVSFVFVPAMVRLPPQELVFTPDPSSKTDALFDSILPPFFRLRPGEAVDSSLIQAQAEGAREAGCVTGMCPHVSPSTLQRAVEEGTLERVALSASDEDDNSSRVYMYWDESANFKRRPVNPRATQYVQYGQQNDEGVVDTIYGDVFLARVDGRQNQPESFGVDALEKEPWFFEKK